MGVRVPSPAPFPDLTRLGEAGSAGDGQDRGDRHLSELPMPTPASCHRRTRAGWSATLLALGLLGAAPAQAQKGAGAAGLGWSGAGWSAR